ncbi:MAG: glycosyltransferase [Deltaproteobacteria bacterium]|jgi:glycosyltransferase involved in cell wall biosynthesis|nr:glycosyltransferase [Deltaproteobacteria bacterium]
MDSSTLKSNSTITRDLDYSVIIPAYNEENLLPATLSSLQQAMESVSLKGEIVVVDNNSTDKTKLVAQQYGARVIFEPHRQIAKARNSGARAAKSDFLVFLDADTIVPPQLLQNAISLLSRKGFCGGGTLLSFDSQLPFLADCLVRFWNWLSKTGKLAAGSFIFCLARGFHDIGGFDENIYAAEEITFSRKIKAWGKKHGLPFTIIDSQPVITSGRKFHWYSSLQIALLLVLFTIFPFALRSRSLCNFWYRRPNP